MFVFISPVFILFSNTFLSEKSKVVMASLEESEEYSDFITVRRKNMRRGKPQQQIYRPGSGPLRKSNNLEETESDTNILINSRQDQFKKEQPEDASRFRSEGSSPRDKIIDLDHTASRLRDISLNIDMSKRNKKPEQMHYVPRPVAQAREDSNSSSFANGNGSPRDSNEMNNTSRARGYGEKNRADKTERNEWREQSPSTGRTRRYEQRGTNNSQGHNWNRSRDTRSVEPTGPPPRAYNTNSEKIQSKPPSGRRHSTVGIEQERRHTKTLQNLDNLPPRLRKKYLEEKNLQFPEESWDGSSVTFQSHPKNPSYHQMGGAYYTLPTNQNPHNQHGGQQGYHTLPNKPRGRGRSRLGYDHEAPPPGHHFNSLTPDRVGSPCDSRPPTPPLSRPHTPVSIGNDYQNSNRDGPRTDNRYFENTVKEGGPRNQDRRDINNRRRDYGNRRYDYGRDGKYFNRDNPSNDWDDSPKDTPKDTPNWDTPHRRDQDNAGGRDGRHQSQSARGDNRRVRGNYTRDRRRDPRDNRRDRDVRSSNRDYNDGCSRSTREENWDLDEGGNNTNVEGLKQSLESQLSPISPEEKLENTVVHQGVGKTLDWSEEVELNDKLESEYLSDTLTRSSSVASLQDVSTKSLPPNLNVLPAQMNPNRSGARENSNSRNRNNRSRQNSTTSVDGRDGFKVPFDARPTKNSREGIRETSYDRYQNSSRNISRDSSWDRHHTASSGPDNWREEIVRSRKNSDKDGKANIEEIKNIDPGSKKAGVIVLPQQREPVRPTAQGAQDHPRYPEISRKSPGQQKSLFDPSNPAKPIIVKSSSSRVSAPGFSDNAESLPPQMYTTDQFGNLRPPWYDENSEGFRSCHYPDLLRDVKRADNELQCIINKGSLLVDWDFVDSLRLFLKEALEYLVCRAIKFCQSENVEQHFWKILYHNIIEVTRKAIKNDPGNKEKYKDFLLYLIDEGGGYFERLLGVLEETYKFKLNSFLGENNMVSHKGLGLVGLALVSAQKLFLFLGDLGRYREEVNETSNYGKCRQWYIKSHEINPKNGKPYNQLAILAVYARRKLDAVYYYMRSLMSSNPVPSARENLISLFDENRKKYEQGEKKRREERLERQRLQMKQKESDELNSAPGSLRKETWIHPEGGRRVHRTTQANCHDKDSDEEDLSALTSVEVNKRFVISYLHVHGKLITKIGMETFQETAMQMLKEFRALLQHSPVPLPCNRFLQLLALNMFAIESTQLKDPQLQSQPGYRSELQERALVVSLQMFNLILERCVSILQDHHASSHKDAVVACLPPDANVLLPAIKIWCDWMLCHTNIWNPPPSTQDFKVGSAGDAWSRLATLMNMMEQMDQSCVGNFLKEPKEGYEAVRLPEDSVLYGFTPLMYTAQEATYAPTDLDAEAIHLSLRLSKLLFFGTVYLCGVDPPVLKLEIEDDVREYVSVVCSPNSRDSPPAAIELVRNNDILLESFSDEEEPAEEEEKITSNAPTEIRDLLTRKVELEKRKRSQDLHMQRVKKILSQSVVSVHMEVRPKYLVPDTNCFIDHLEGICIIAQSHCYTLMVPIVVLSELEGLSRGGKAPTPDSRTSLDLQHVRKVAKSAKSALDFLKTRHASLKCVTTKGAILPSTTFSTEDDATWDSSLSNDDKILTTCIVLCKGHKIQPHEMAEGEPRHLEREVVLLTDDRNLRVKAHARDVPVRELPDFMRWAGLG